MGKRAGTRMMAAALSGMLILSGTPQLPALAAEAAEKIVSFTSVSREASFTYHRDFADGLGNFAKVSSGGTLKEGERSASMEGDGIFIDQDSVAAKNTEVEFTFNPKSVNCNYGVILRYVSPQEYLYVGPARQNNQHYTLWGVYNQGGKVADISDAGFVLDGRETPYKVKVRVVNKVVTVFLDNEIIYSAKVNNITEKAGKVGFRTTASTGMDVYEFTQTNAVELTESTQQQSSLSISSSAMTVAMDAAFPRVLSYTLSGGGAATGQEKPYYQVEINNKVYENPAVTVTAGTDRVTYHVEISDEGVSYAFDVVYTVQGNVLDMRIQNIEDEDDKIYTINFPEQSMVSMSSKAANGKLRVNNYQSENTTNLASRTAQEGFAETSLAVLSCDTAAAAMSGESYKNRKEIAYKTVNCGDHTSTGLWLNEFTYRGVDGKVEIEEPWARAAVVGDRNGDGKIDYQDGAIALRDLCKERKTGADTVISTWPMIAMNVGSEAQYPFLRILDNIKKMNLATDGFGQNVIIKGYQSEGHDAAHPDFANYNQRAGGLEDLNTLLENSEKYNAKVGVHINHTDIYPEAPQYAKLASSLSAWSWYDSSVGTIRENDDLDESVNGLDSRLAKLFDADTDGKMDTVYVDVFFGTRWPMYKLVSNIAGRGLVMGTEYVDEMVSYSVFAHHLVNNFDSAGNLVRFVENNQADIFKKHQLFRGVDNRNDEQCGINGWQGAKDLNKALTAFYTKILPNKYLANFPVMRYENNNKAVLGAANEVVTEMVNGVNVITKDGKKVAEGNKIFIPWNPQTEEKIYHYNPAGGASEWELPDSWSGVGSVNLYKLSDTGKSLVGTLRVSGQRVTVSAEAGVGYVLYKGDAEGEGWSAESMEWSTGSPVKDMGFDSHSFRYWQKDASADHIVIENNALGNSHLYMKGTQAGEVSQEITGLIPGQSYSASVWAITEDGRRASILIDDGEDIYENYMDRSNVTYGYHHNDKYQTKAQRMSVRFVAKSDKATLTLAADAGYSAESIVDFDDVRVMKCDMTDVGEHTYFEDFEHVDQGMGIFVSPETDQSHLSQKNPLNPEFTPDVIDGTYSLKVRAGNYLRTMPFTVRFEPNSEYTVRLDYKASGANAFTAGVKSDLAAEAQDHANAVLATADAALGNMVKGSLELKFTTGDYDDYYLDITKKSATEYVIDNVAIDKAKPMNAQTLGELIEKAARLKESEYTPDSWKRITQMAEEAKKALAQGQDAIAEAYQNLDAAIEEAVRYAGKEEKAALNAQIQELKAISAADYAEDIHWMIFEATLEEAQELAQNTKAQTPQVEKMLASLEEAKKGLTAKVDRSMIRTAIDKAQAVARHTVVDGWELQTFLSALEEAKKTDQKKGVTAAEIAAAAAKLNEAYGAIVVKDDALKTMLREALEKTEADMDYFRAEDREALGGIKEELTGMWGRSSVPAKECYELLDELETVLSHKQERPVLANASLNELQCQAEAFGKMDSEIYTADSFAALEKLVRAAEELLADAGASAEDANALFKQLQKAKAALVIRPTSTDRKILQKAVQQAQKVNPAEYANAGSFQQALAQAQTVLAAGVSQKEMQDAAYQLYQAQKALVKKGDISESLAGASVGAVANKAYTGKAIKPQVTVAVGARKLTEGTDYTVSYQKNINPGKAVIVITGKGKYTGSKTVSFKIVPKKAAIKKATAYQKKAVKVTWKRDAKADGYQVWCSLKKNFKGSVKKVIVKKNKTVKTVVKKRKSKKKYYVRIRSYKVIDNAKEYGAFSKVKTVKTK